MNEHAIDAIELFRHLMDNTPDHIYFKDRQSRFIRINRAQAEWMKLASPDEAVGKTDFDFFAPEHANAAYEDEQRIIRTGQPVLGKEEKETWPDGSVTWVSTTKLPLRDRAGTIVGTFGTSRDITEHRLAQEKATRYAWRLRDVNRQMRNELAMARELQEAFLPRRYPTFPPSVLPDESALRFCHFYHAAGMVGGDFFTVDALTERTAVIFVCDVMGHGVQAALVTAIIRTLVNEWCHVERDPGALLTRVNTMLLPFLRRDEMLIFSSAFCLTLDVLTGLAKFASAGHPSPIWLHADGSGVEPLVRGREGAGPALALDETYVYHSRERQFALGDKVLLFTDGLFEIDSPAGEEYGAERLQDSVARHAHEELEQLFTSLHGDIAAFACGQQFKDDVCMVGMEYRHLGGRDALVDPSDTGW